MNALEPFEFDFFRNGVMAATVAGALCGLVGVYVVQRGMSYIGHGLSHAIFGGAVASYVLSVNFYVGAGLWGFAAALLINAVARRRSIGADAAIGVVTTASFAVGLALISRYSSFTRNFEAALFGDVLGVTRTDVVVLVAVLVLTTTVVLLRYRALLFASFDAEVAEVSGVNTARIDALLALVLAGSILATMRVLGVTLIAAALVIPPVVARLFTHSFARLLVGSTAVGAFCGLAGMNLSYHLDISSGATIVLVGAAIFLAAYAVTGIGLRRTV